MSEALSTLAAGGSLITLGYSGGRKATIDVTDLIWKRATIKSFALFVQRPAAWEEAWNTIVPLLQCGRIKAYRSEGLLARRGVRCYALPCRGPPIRQARTHHIATLM